MNYIETNVTDMVNISTDVRKAMDEHEARQRLHKARIVTRAKRAANRKNWAQTWRSAAVGLFSIVLFVAMDAGAVPMALAIPATGMLGGMVGLIGVLFKCAVVIE